MFVLQIRIWKTAHYTRLYFPKTSPDYVAQAG